MELRHFVTCPVNGNSRSIPKSLSTTSRRLTQAALLPGSFGLDLYCVSTGFLYEQYVENLLDVFL
jgi:hypothetical protein